MSFFPFRAPAWTPKPRKTRGFLIMPKALSATPKATKHRKTRCFWTPWAGYTVNYIGFGDPEVTPRSPRGDPEVTPRWPRAGRRLGRHSLITFGYQPKASGKDTARLGSGRRPDPYVGPILAFYVGPILPLWSPYLSPMLPLAYLSPMLAPSLTLCGPYLAPMLALSGPYVGPILALGCPVSLTLA